MGGLVSAGPADHVGLRERVSRARAESELGTHHGVTKTKLRKVARRVAAIPEVELVA